MTSKTAVFVDIVLDKPRRLFYNLNAMAAYEKETGKNFLDIPKETVSATLLRAVLWAGLIHEDKTLTIDTVGDIMFAGNMAEIQGKIVEAAAANAPETVPGPEGQGEGKNV